MTKLIHTLGPVALLLPAMGLAAQERPVAIVNAHILTMAGDAIESGTVVLRRGLIDAVGADVEPPPGATVIDANGGTLMPGFVSAYSHAGLQTSSRSRPSSSRSSRRPRGFGRPSSRGRNTGKNEAAKKVTGELYARQDVFAELLRCGVTTIGLAPRGSGFPGRGAVIDPAGKDLQSLATSDDAFVVVAPATGTANKKLIKDSFESAHKRVVERGKPAAPPAAKKPSAPAAGEKGAAKPKDAPAKGGQKKEEKPEGKKNENPEKPAPKPKTDPNIEVLADLLEGKSRAYLEIGSAADLVHFLDAIGDQRVPHAVFVEQSYIASRGRLDEVIDKLEPWHAPILVSPTLTSPNYSRAVINPAARLAGGGIDVGFILGDSKASLRNLPFRLMDLVRHGLDRDLALRAVTAVPAAALGVSERVGTIEKGKDGDILLFNRDPLDPAARLTHVWHHGQRVEQEKTQ